MIPFALTAASWGRFIGLALAALVVSMLLAKPKPKRHGPRH